MKIVNLIISSFISLGSLATTAQQTNPTATVQQAAPLTYSQQPADSLSSVQHTNRLSSAKPADSPSSAPHAALLISAQPPTSSQRPTSAQPADSRSFTKPADSLSTTQHANPLSSSQHADPLARQIDTVKSNAVSEKLFVHTDKTTYIAGEILWFKIYNVDASFHHMIDLSKVAYIDIIDRNNTAVAQAKIALNKKGSGSIALPLSIGSGKYKLRAYTSWMKNGGPETFFEQVITIINPLKSLDIEKPVTKLAYMIAFFPEGGNLVQGLESQLAFKLTDETGKGIEGKGVVISNSGDTISKFATFKFGIGSFTFQPQQGKTYKTHIFPNGGNQFVQELPAAQQTGYSISLNEKGEALTLSVQSNEPGQEGQPVYLLVHTRGITKVMENAKVSNGSAVFNIEKTKAGEGVSQFTLFDHKGQPVAERLYFRRPHDANNLTVQTDKASYDTRSKVLLTSHLTASNTLPPNLSLSVYRLDSLQSSKGADIRSYLWLTSDLSGVVESPEYYLSASSPETEKATDLLMLSHGWRRLNWRSRSISQPVPKYPLEYNGHLLTARVIDTRTGTPAADVPVFLSIPGQYFNLFTANSDAHGLVHFDVKDVYGPSEIYLQANTPKENYYRFEVVNPFADQYSASAIPLFRVLQDETLLEDHSIAMQAQNLYRGDSLRLFDLPFIRDTLPFYGKSDYTYLLDDYTRFNTMEEVLREYVRFINVTMRGGKLYMSIFDENLKLNFEDNLLVAVDGVPLVDKNKIFDYDPHKVRRLDVIPRGYLLGPHYFRGVASFTTYNGNLDGFNLDPRVLMVNYDGLQLQREFYAPVYETASQQNSRIPDFRTTLLWNPGIATDEKGTSELNFYTSDNKGQYLGVLQGMDGEANPVSATFTFTVK